MSEDTAIYESDLRRVAESLLRSRPDLANPNKLRQFKEMLDRRAATLNSLGDNVLQEMASTDRRPTKPTPEERFLWFVMDLGVGLLPALFIAATFPRFPLPILPVIVLVGFFASPYLFKADRPGRSQDKPGSPG